MALSSMLLPISTRRDGSIGRMGADQVIHQRDNGRRTRPHFRFPKSDPPGGEPGIGLPESSSPGMILPLGALSGILQYHTLLVQAFSYLVGHLVLLGFAQFGTGG